MKKLLTLIILSNFTLSGWSLDFSPRATKAFNYLYALKIDSANFYFNQLKVYEPKNRVDGYLKHTEIFLTLFLSEDHLEYEKQQNNLETYLNRVSQEPNRNTFSLYCEAEIYFQQSILAAKFGESFTAGRKITKAYDVLEELLAKDKGFAPAVFLKGLIELGFGSLPPTYKWLASMFGYEGDIDKGYENVKWGYSKSLELYPYLRLPFSFTYGYTVFQMGLDPNFSTSSLNVKTEESNLILFLDVSILFSKEKNTEALLLLMDRPVEGVYDYPYLYYLEGKARLAVMDSKAINCFEDYLRIYKGKHFIKSTYRYLMWSDIIWNKGLRSWDYKDKIENTGFEFRGADQEALLELKRPLTKELIKARLAFDGGTFLLAEEYLNSINFDQLSDFQKVEWYYRRGRVTQAMGEYDEAEKNYLKCLSSNKQRDTYQAAKSSMQLAHIYEFNMSKPKKAKMYYELAMSYSGYPYYEGVYRQGKAGLRRLK